MSRKRKGTKRVPKGRYQSTPFGELKVTSAFCLLNVVVFSVEADSQTNGPFSPEVAMQMSALTRQVYDFPDADLAAGTGVVLSVLPFLINPDDYISERVAVRHARAVVAGLEQQRPRVAFDMSGLRATGTPDLLRKTEEGVLPMYYKQRFLSFCFLGPRDHLDRFWDEPPPDLVPNLVAILGDGIGLGDDVFVLPHPRLEPARRAVRVSQANMQQWLEIQEEAMDRTGQELVGFLRQSGSWPHFVYRRKEE